MQQQCVKSAVPPDLKKKFADIQVQLQRRRRQKKQTQEECEALLARKLAADRLRGEIQLCRERIELLKSLTKECRKNIAQGRTRADRAQHTNVQLSERLPRYKERVAELEKNVQSREEAASKMRSELQVTRKRLQSVVQTRVAQLTRYIFPVFETIPESRSEDSDSGEDSICSAIAEASHMAFVRGRWVFSECSGELHHKIVAPLLPASGDYSAYSMWVAANKDGIPAAGGADSVEHNPAYTISAALTYTAQLVNILAFYLDVRLPRKQCYSEFCRHEMTDSQFTRRVARLNGNVLHLCFSQNVPPSALHPTRTLANLSLLLDSTTSQLGRQGPVEVDPGLARSLQEQLLRDLATLEGSEEDSCSDGEEDQLPGEWEAVPSLPYQESGAGALVARSSAGDRGGLQGHGSGLQSSSVAGGLVTSAAASIASIWRGWTGNK